ncbi:MAG TPA: hypothetical protein VNA13_04395 [Xanthomonadales bacterium]|nr:hypothetical protein [Xanthomonadales bacterium]
MGNELDMSTFRRGRAFQARVLDIQQTQIEEGTVDTVRVMKRRTKSPSEFPLAPGQEFAPGSQITITPLIKRHESGGSLTVFELKPKTPHQAA